MSQQHIRLVHRAPQASAAPWKSHTTYAWTRWSEMLAKSARAEELVAGLQLQANPKKGLFLLKMRDRPKLAERSHPLTCGSEFSSRVTHATRALTVPRIKKAKGLVEPATVEKPNRNFLSGPVLFSTKPHQTKCDVHTCRLGMTMRS